MSSKEKKILLRSKTPTLVIQELYGIFLAHFSIRGIMHEAALKEGIPPEDLSFSHSVRVIRRRLNAFPVFFPSKAATVSPAGDS